MKSEVRKTLDDLLTIFRNWKAFWLTQYTPEGPNEWIMQEITGLMFGDDTYAYGYFSSSVRRLLETELITKEEHSAFWSEVYDELDDMREQLCLPKPEHAKVTPLFE